jgi:metallophosphoesterase (TIGR00282 family)
MRVLFVGDIVGDPGMRLACQAIPWLRQRDGLDLVVANAENACDGAGFAPSQYHRLRKAGVDAFTLGDHVYRKREIIDIMNEPMPRVGKPANYPAAAPGAAWLLVPAVDGTLVAVVSLLGRQFMKPADCPFAAAERVLAEIKVKTPLIIVDIHAEATADKMALGRWLDGKVSAVLGTHTHVPTADEQILPSGTAYQTDVGMTGPYDSVLGRRTDRVIAFQRTGVPNAFDVASGDPRLAGAVIDLNPLTGQAHAIRRVMVRAADVPAAAALEAARL